MGFFTVGNLLTLGIALLFLVLFRQMDKNNRHMKKLRDYSEILKKDLASFVGEQENAIKDYGVSLNVERDSAKELMKRLQLTEEELAGKAAAMTHIDNQIKSYENSLAELDRMTNRVQENMNRIRDESAFVESTGKRISEAKARLDEIGKALASLESTFERENTLALEKAAESVLAGVASAVSDLSATAETIERKVEDHREEINRIERNRATDLARDVAHINEALKNAVEQAGKRADKMEEAALQNLKEQAEDRLRRLKTAEEERLKGYQENAKARVAEAQTLIKNFKEEWQTERAEWERGDKAFRDERRKDILELETSLEASEQRLAAAKTDMEHQMQELSARTDAVISSREAEFFKTAGDMTRKALETTGARLEEYQHGWQAERAEWERTDKALREERKNDLQELETSLQEAEQRLAAAKAGLEHQMQELSARADTAISLRESEFFKTAGDMTQKALETTEARLEEYREGWQAERTEWEHTDKMLRDERKNDLRELETSLQEAEQRLAAAKAGLEHQMQELSARADTAISLREAEFFKTAGDMTQKALETAGARLEEYREGWQTERAEWEHTDKMLRDERKNDLRELETSLQEAEQRLTAAKAEFESQMRELSGQTDRILSSQEAVLAKAAGDMARKALEATGVKLEKYRESWQAERADWESRDKALRDERKSDMRELGASLQDAEKRLAAAKTELERQMQELAARTDAVVSSREAQFIKTAGDMTQKALETTGARLEEYREGWQTERAEWEIRDKALRDERKSDARELEASLKDTEQRLAAAKAEFETQMRELSERTSQIVSSQEAMIVRAAEEIKEKALEITGTKLEEYRHAQDAEFRRLETLADDSKKLDEELRLSMRDVVGRVQEDLSRYERESEGLRKAELDKFSGVAAALRKELAELENEFSGLKTAAYDNVSQKLKGFEEGFFTDLSKRSGDIDQRLAQWQDDLERRLSKMGEEAEAGRWELERSLTEEMRKQLSAHDARLVSALEHLKAETSAFGDRIQGEMSAADESVVSLKEQLAANLEEARKGAEIYIKAEIGKHSLEAAESLKQYHRELDGKFREVSEYIQTRNAEISGLVDASRADLAGAREGLTAKIRELDDSIEDARRRVKDLSAENDSRIAVVRSSVEDAQRHIKEAVDQTKLVDKVDALRLDLGQRIDQLKSDIERLDQRRAEAFQLENDFVKIKRLQDDVNAKMTRFLSEKRKIETMEADFGRLLKISHAVEEKLTQVIASDDTLQGIQLQFRKLEEALGATDDKFQRIERKNQILDNTNDGIDRNFKALQESEKISAKIGGDLDRYAEDVSSLRSSIEKLAGESEKARQAADKIDVLDSLLQEIEAKIDSMQRARQSIAGMETRLEQLNKDAQTQARAIDSMVKGKKTKSLSDLGDGSKLTPQERKENIIALARQGWKEDEIAKALKISRGEVEVTLDLASLD
ncbi:MAG: hypothetical protein FWC64_02970 [Treponema sp.]|nr:hypothetical protein [Treponema sp.]